MPLEVSTDAGDLFVDANTDENVWFRFEAAGVSLWQFTRGHER
jgi:hypothetical protein